MDMTKRIRRAGIGAAILAFTALAAALPAGCATTNQAVLENTASPEYVKGLYGESMKQSWGAYDQAGFAAETAAILEYVGKTKSLDDAQKAERQRALESQVWVDGRWVHFHLNTNGVSVLWKVKDIKVDLRDAAGAVLAEAVSFQDWREEVRNQLGTDYVYHYVWRIRTAEPFGAALGKDRLPARLVVSYPDGSHTTYALNPGK
jgi:hypothetical protein